ncbi:MAG TPA: hypothetical protein VGP76_04690 [Planctomycetaceae bacterium]|jgi:hypothetical protein|nr:hypothetical protein [Planctomycetaceae bacterium]
MSKLSYTTPYGLYNGQADASGVWRVAYHMALIDSRPDVGAKLVTNLLRTFSTIDDPLIPKAPRFDPAARQLRWTLPNIPGLSPLVALERKPSVDQLKRLIAQLAEQSEKLHRTGLGVFDLSPSLIFATPDLRTAVLVPSITLASEAVGTAGHVQRMPYAAPELEQAQTICAAPARADVFALGALAWFLLTGLEKKKHRLTFPSDHSPSLAEWDVFVDGCCRTNPARRYSSVREALESLPGTSAAKLPAIQAASRTSRALPAAVASGVWAALRFKKGRSAAALVCGVIALLVWFGAYLRRDELAAEHPWIGGFLVSYERGVGDTVLKYANRSYEGATWKKLKEVDSLAKATEVDGASLRPSAIFGWDDQNFWILFDARQHGAAVFQQQDGVWKFDGFAKKVPHPTGRALDRERILVTSRDSAAPLYEFSPKGIFQLGDKDIPIDAPYNSSAELCIVAPDLVYRIGAAPLTAISNGKDLTKFRDTNEAFVLRDNMPLKEFPAYRIRFTRPSSEGTAFGVAERLGGGGSGARFQLVRFTGGFWHSLEDDLPDFRDAHQAWLTGPARSPSHLVLVGPQGKVVVHEIGGKSVDQTLTINPASGATSRDLIAVWGVTTERYWVMDKSGTVWQRSEKDWTQIVRRPDLDKVEFMQAWVSRTGTILAITQKDVYRLE